MGNKWGSRLLGELCHEITVGFVGSMTNEYIETGIPFLRSKNIDEYDVKWDDMKYVSPEFHKKLSKSALKPGDVAIVRTGKPGTTCVIPNSLKEANCSDVVIARVNNDLLCPHYLSYFMNAMSHGQVNAHVVGAVQQHFNVGSAKKLEIPLPSRAIQSEIVQVLKTLDDKLKLNRQINQTLEQMAQALFKSWFVDFDPVIDNALDAGFFEQDLAFPDELLRRAAARRAVREHGAYLEKSKPLPDAIRQLFPATFEECVEPSLGLGGWVPKGWGILQLKDLSEKISKGTTPRSRDIEVAKDDLASVLFVKVKDMTDDNRVRLDSLESIPKSVSTGVLKRSVLCERDILLSIAGTIGRIASVEKELDGSNCNQAVAFLRPKDKKAHHLFIKQTLQSERVRQYIDSKVVQAVQANFSLTHFGEIQTVLPSDQVMQQFNLLATAYSSRTISNLRQIDVLTRLRDTLLPKLISGELRLDQIEADLTKEGMA